MTEQRGVAARIIQQIKVTLAKQTVNKSQRKREGSTPTYNTDHSDRAIATSSLLATSRSVGKPKYAAMDEEQFEKILRAKSRDARQLEMDLHLKRFGDEAVRQQVTFS
jgi:hypothetical protein